MVTILKAVKEIKASVVKLEEKVDKTHNDEIQEIINAQKNLEDVIALNSEPIKRIDNEILRMQNDKAEADPAKDDAVKAENKAKQCKYFNRAHCKFTLECRFVHPKEICRTYLDGKTCYEKLCQSRHQKVCKWWEEKRGCKRQDCDYLHVTLVFDDV